MDIWRIGIRALVCYVYLLAMTRASGKRMISEATPFDFVVALIIGDLIDDALWADVSMASFGAATASIFVCDAVTKMLALRSSAFSRLVCGTPTIVLRDGVEDGRALRGEQLSEGDLDHLLRLEGVENRDDVRLGIVERDHSFSVLYRPELEPATREDADRVGKMLE